MKKKKAKSVHAWTIFFEENGYYIPLFMAACCLDMDTSKRAKIKSEIVMRQFKQLYPDRKYRVGKVTLMEGWK